MTTILVTGPHGQMGRALGTILKPYGKIVALDRKELDLSQPGTLAKKIREIRPDIIVNAAAYTNVEKAESDPELAMMINGIAPGVIAAEAKNLGALLIHYSTDYVFDGTGSQPYPENARTHPLGVYGKTKLEGEKAIQGVDGKHLILRTSWIYSGYGKNFLLTMLKLAKERQELKIVADQIGTPNWSGSLAAATGHILQRSLQWNGDAPWGIYNVSAAGETSWFGFADAIFRESAARGLLQQIPILVPIGSEDYPSAVARPKFSVLDREKVRGVFGLELPHWTQSLKMCLDTLTKEPS